MKCFEPASFSLQRKYASLKRHVRPGPNNMMLWASGMQFGFRAYVPNVAGTSIGLGTMALAVAAVIGALDICANPGR